ncbi:MAG: hypothetical protein NC936_01255 [Candidatus Omnitrophica bacterium]|nr:hypothetical protein [Candidatus Omnitrophota bacterium]
MYNLLLALLLISFYFVAKFTLSSKKGYNFLLGLSAAVTIVFCTLALFSFHHKKMNALAVILMLIAAICFYAFGVHRRFK